MPIKPMRDEIAAAGKYRHPLLNQEFDRLRVITAKEIIDGVKLDLPMARTDAVRSADEIGDAHKQDVLL